MQATLRDELRVALCRRGLPAREPKEDLIKKLMRGRRAQARTEEAAVALLLVRRRLGSRLGGLTLTGDAGAIEWIVEVCKADVRRQAPGWTTLEEAFGKLPGCEELPASQILVKTARLRASVRLFCSTAC